MEEFKWLAGFREPRSSISPHQVTVFPRTWGARGWTGGVDLGLRVEKNTAIRKPIRQRWITFWTEIKKKQPAHRSNDGF